MDKRMVLAAIILLAAIDAAYLVAVQLSPGLLYCYTSGPFNCAGVLESAYSHVFGIPMSFLGLIWSIIAFYIFIKSRNSTLHFIWIIAGAGGVLYSLTAMTLLWEICEYCLALDVLISLTIITFLWKWKAVLPQHS
jgi:uncharacterized membrane protein